MSKSTNPLVVFTTVAKKSDAARISKAVIESRLAACVTTLPQSESRYLWQGKVCVEKEYLLMIKTLPKAFNRLKAFLTKIHPYDCPEILGVNASEVSAPYFRWLKENITPSK